MSINAAQRKASVGIFRVYKMDGTLEERGHTRSKKAHGGGEKGQESLSRR